MAVKKRKVGAGRKKGFGLKKVKGTECFFFCDGRVCSGLSELADMIDSSDEGVFYHHVTDDRNDFANWVEGVFGEKSLADVLRGNRNKDRHVVEILRFLVLKLS